MYKTIILELLEQRPQLNDQLLKDRILLATIERLAEELKARHQTWKQRLEQTKPGSHPSQIASEALEMALSEVEGRLPHESPATDPQSLSLDQAMAFLAKPTSGD